MVRNLFLLGLSIFFLFQLVLVSGSEWPVCIDTQYPEAPTGLSITGNVILNWNVAVDLPECSGIDYYVIYREGIPIGTTTSTSFTDEPLGDGTYVYNIYAVDKAGNEGDYVTGSIKLGSTGNQGNSNTGGSTGSSSSSTYTPPPENNTNETSNNSNSNGEENQTIDLNETTICEENWSCGEEWFRCFNGVQKRVCTDLNDCGTEENKPSETQACLETSTENTISHENNSFLSTTGRFLTSPAGAVSIFGLLLVLIVGFLIYQKKFAGGK